MNIQLIPDLAAMATLLTILYFLRKRHPQQGVELWIAGLLCIFLESIAHIAYVSSQGASRIPSHIVALDAYLAAGMIFIWSGARNLYPRRATLFFLIATSLPLAALQTAYALAIRRPGPYHAVAVVGILVGVVAPFLAARSFGLERGWWLLPAQLAIWVPAWLFASAGMYRDAAYFSLFVLYLAAAVLSHLSLPSGSLGRVAIVMGFTIWSLVFLFHSWVSARPEYVPLAAEIWDWQKFLVAIGMLLVMLERQVATNEWYAFHDQLTGLPNRRLFEERLEEAIRTSHHTGRRVALAMIDLDGFKRTNDSLGHEVGDQLLQQIALQLRQVIRAPDTLARLGGDEFIIISGDLPAEMPLSHLVNLSTNRIVDAMKRSFQIAGQDLEVGASIGVAVYPDEAEDEVALRRTADERMYRHKKQSVALAAVEL